MIKTQYINLDMTPSGVLPVLYCSQYDVGRPLGMVVYNGGEAVDLAIYTCTIEATRTDGTAITAPVTTDGNVGEFATTATMTNKTDKYLAKMVIVDSDGNRVASLAFVMCVTPATMDENAESIEEDASLYQQYTGTVQTLIATERQQRQSADSALQSDIDAESSARAAGDSNLSVAINTEASARQSADETLQSNINAEAAARTSGDANLQNQINQLIIQPGDAPSAEEILNARIGADGVTYTTLGDAIRGQVSDLSDTLATESIVKTATSPYSAPFEKSSYIVYSTGKYYEGTTGAKCTSRIPLSGFKSISVFGYVSNTAALIAFYDKHDNYLQSISVQATGASGGQYAEIDLTDPAYANACYAIASDYPSTVQSYCKLTPQIDLTTLSASAQQLLTLNPSEYNNLLANVDANGFFVKNNTDSWSDPPDFFPNCMIANYKYSQNYALQIAYNVTSGFLATRIVNCTEGSVYRDWKTISTDDYEYCRILCVGDSIAYGMRNNQKGFVGDLGVQYENKAISGATLSNASEPTLRAIPRQLIEAYGNIPFYPDNIIAEGGINDYVSNVPLGTLSSRPAYNDTEANALNRNTVIGATEYLFYQMIKLYPKAHRFFLITHKTLNYPYTNNSAGYNQQDLHDALVECCNLYNVEVIDVYAESVINTMYIAYKSPVAWADDPTTADAEYVDLDGVHPCKYGYAQGYVPFVKRALKIGVRNH